YARTVPSRVPRGRHGSGFGPNLGGGNRSPTPRQEAGTTRRVSQVTRFVGRWAGPLWRLRRRCDVGTFERAGPVVAAVAIERAQPRFDGESGTSRGRAYPAIRRNWRSARRWWARAHARIHGKRGSRAPRA